MAKDAPGMRGYRSRNEDGELREKRGDPCRLKDQIIGWYEQGSGAVKEAIEKGKEAAVESKEKLRPAA